MFPDALPTLHDLDRLGHEIVILTSKPHWAVSDTFEWIGSKGLPTTEVHILDDKWEVSCDIYLDDGPHIIRDLPRHRPESNHVSLRQTVERGKQGHGFYRVVGRLRDLRPADNHQLIQKE